MSPSLGVFVVWASGRTHEEQILEYLDREFTIVGVDEVHWSAERIEENYSRFYRVSGHPPFRTSLPHYKGRGPFLVIVVEDEDPLFGERMTMGGIRTVSTRIVDAKAQFREWTGGGVKVHSSDSPTDATRDLMLLLGVTPEEYLADRSRVWAGEIGSVHRDVVGSEGWTDLGEMLGALGCTTEYVVLSRSDEQIEILTSRYRWSLAITRARPGGRFAPRWGGTFLVTVAGHEIELVVRFVGDGYVDPRWASDIIGRRVRAKDGSFEPNNEDGRMLALYESVVLGAAGDSVHDRQSEASLWMFLSDRGYEITEPHDLTVSFRPPGHRRSVALKRSVMSTVVGLAGQVTDPVRFGVLVGRERVLKAAPWLRRFGG